MKKDKGKTILVGMSMEDFLPVATHRTLIDDLYNVVKAKYTVKRLGRPDKYLNWTIQYSKAGIHLAQPQHVDSVVAMLTQTQCNPESTPYLEGVRGDPPTPNEATCEDIAVIYGKAVGGNRYIADSTRPDIAYAATSLA